MALPPPLSRATNGPNRLGGLQQEVVRIVSTSSTTTYTLHVAINGDQVLDNIEYVTDTSLAASGSNYWTVSVVNAGLTGVGATAVTTPVTTVAGTTAFKKNTLSFASPSVRSVADGEVLKLTLTKAASAGAFRGVLVLEFRRAVTY